MKKINLSQKLSLNKSLVSKLNTDETADIKGGSAVTHCFCEKTKIKKCETKVKTCGPIDSVIKSCVLCEVTIVRTYPTIC